ncbi:MAG: flagellar biosynthesis protein FlhA [Oligoflexia bacterium]|nr:flagellar biosynthesis protein FlhA [Oligoflexia bacterium]MBF0364589.1 flagellar biosynthesis protein FlhA [Oligoflexia bacterium]
MKNLLNKLNFLTKSSDLVLVVGLVLVLSVMVIPVAPFILDLLIASSLALSIIVLLMAVYTKRPIDFSTFPSVLLILTLYRLSLNVASTRNILLRTQSDGHSAAGEIIRAFGDFVVGGNFAVGLVVFIILVIINFIVITKGAGRVAEVGARFTLDAMPGKQMAIDADLNAGLIDDKEAKRRRQQVAQEADFYGAMDGASKFVRGDAIAAILITIVNIIGGIIVGVGQYDMSFIEASKLFTLLTVGDGLITQIPALIVSTAAGIIITRGADEESLGTQVTNQVKIHHRAIYTASGILFAFALVPGLPKIPFLAMGGLLAYAGNSIEKKGKIEVESNIRQQQEDKKKRQENLEELLPLEMIELEVGYAIVNLVDVEQNGDLLERITQLRRQFALDWGVIIPSVRIRDNLELRPGGYVIKLKGVAVAQGELMPDHFLAMDPGTVIEKVDGVETTEPVYGFPALWINPDIRDSAQYSGYTVVDLSTVMATHLTEVWKKNLHEMFGRQELVRILDNFKELYPKVVSDLIPDILSFGVVLKVMQNLLREAISIRDIRSILEALAEHGAQTKDPQLLTEYTRQALYRTITESVKNGNGEVSLFTLDRRIEEEIYNRIVQNDKGSVVSLSPDVTQKILVNLNEKIEDASGRGDKIVVACSPSIRAHFKKITEKYLPNLVVVGHNELANDARIKNLGVIRM